MNQDREHKPAKRQPLSAPFAEPGMDTSPFFTMPSNVPTGGELVVPPQQPVINEQRPWPPSPQLTGPIADQLVRQTPDQQPQTPLRGQGLAGGDRAQLQRLCRHLRRTGRCPGQCVLSRARHNRLLRRFPDMR